MEKYLLFLLCGVLGVFGQHEGSSSQKCPGVRVVSDCTALPANATCFGVALDYTHTSYSAFTNSTTYWDVQPKLEVRLKVSRA